MKLYGVTGWKNCGKTGLMERLVSEFTDRGLKVSTIKHAHHSTDVDQPGTDSHRHRMAGASEVVLASAHRVAVMQELRGAKEPTLQELLARISPVDPACRNSLCSQGIPCRLQRHRIDRPVPRYHIPIRQQRCCSSWSMSQHNRHWPEL